MHHQVPLVVDLDGSYLKTDTLHELLLLSVRKPAVFFRAFGAYFRSGKAAAKSVLASALPLEAGLLPVNPSVAALIQAESSAGRDVVLATGADARIAAQFIHPAGPFANSLSSDGSTNLTGPRKAAVLVERFGAGGFDYVGNSSVDREVWAAARNSYLATTSSQVPRKLRNMSFFAILEGGGRTRLRAWIKAVRPHQSLKNALLFLPLLAAHELGNVDAWMGAIAGFVVFSLMASSVYLLNDALDLASDRQHAKKRNRPIAAGDILPGSAVAASVMLAVIALVAGSLLGFSFFVVLCGYAVTTIAYSFWLKRITLVDVLVLAALYMVRIFAGAVLAGIELSFWFIAVSTFLFLSLAFAKRFAEVIAAGDSKVIIPGRGYRSADGLILAALGSGAGVATVVFLASYIQSPEVQYLYRSPELLWLVVPLVFYWIANVWIHAGRGDMHVDPVVFALRNQTSQITAVLILIFFLLSAIYPQLIAG